MNKKRILSTSIICSAVATCISVNASDHDHTDAEYIHTFEELKSFNLSKKAIFDDNQFVFNNSLALQDWDTIFDSYSPNLKAQQTIIMHYAGYYSINPKLLISLIELTSSALSTPSKSSLIKPFGDLSSKTGFKEQTKDIAKQLSKRFYSFRKMEIHNKSKQKTVISKISPTSAASVAIIGLLNKNSNVSLSKGNKKNNKASLSALLSTYENIFVENKNQLLKSNETKVNSNNSNDKRSTTAVAIPNLYLPWTSGWSWRSGGAHGYDGATWPLSSLDLYYPYGNTGWGGNKPAVYASHGGTVTWLSRCQMRITHASGIATNYYHMDDLQYGSGSYINAGTYIGTYANNYNESLCEGGQSSGPHLHISLIKNGYWESLQGYNFSGYYVQVGTSQYDANCSRSYLWKNGTTYCHGKDIYKPYE